MKNRNLIIALFVLVALNITLLGLLWYTNQPPKDRLPDREPNAYMHFFKRFNFTEEQAKIFKSAFIEHRRLLRPKFMKMSELRSALFMGAEQLSNEERDRILTELSDTQRAADSLTYAHFKEVYELCNPDQKRKMDAFVRQMVNRDRRGNSRP